MSIIIKIKEQLEILRSKLESYNAAGIFLANVCYSYLNSCINNNGTIEPKVTEVYLDELINFYRNLNNQLNIIKSLPGNKKNKFFILLCNLLIKNNGIEENIVEEALGYILNPTQQDAQHDFIFPDLTDKKQPERQPVLNPLEGATRAVPSAGSKPPAPGSTASQEAKANPPADYAQGTPPGAGAAVAPSQGTPPGAGAAVAPSQGTPPGAGAAAVKETLTDVGASKETPTGAGASVAVAKETPTGAGASVAVAKETMTGVGAAAAKETPTGVSAGAVAATPEEKPTGERAAPLKGPPPDESAAPPQVTSPGSPASPQGKSPGEAVSTQGTPPGGATPTQSTPPGGAAHSQGTPPGGPASAIPAASTPGGERQRPPQDVVDGPPPIESLAPAGKPAIRLTMGLAKSGEGDNHRPSDEALRLLVDSIDLSGFKAGKPLKSSFNLPKEFVFPPAIEVNKFFKDDLGLDCKFEKGRIVISSLDPKPHDDNLFIALQVASKGNGHGPTHEIFKKDLYIAPDPRSLWNNLPVADFEGYVYPIEASDCVPIPDWDKTLVAASCRGRSHAHVGKPRDDNYFFKVDDPSGWRLLAVADGAGSARFSRKGSDLACKTMVGLVGDLLASERFAAPFTERADRLESWRQKALAGNLTPEVEARYRDEFSLDKIIYNAVYNSYTEILEEAKKKRSAMTDQKITVKDFHTTLLFIAIKKFSFGYFYLSFWIGDGGLAICRPDKKETALILGSPDTGEYAGQTRFLTMVEEIDESKVRQRTRCGFLDDFQTIILATDGITDPYLPSEASVRDPKKWLDLRDRILKDGDGENPGAGAALVKGADHVKRAEALRAWLDFWSKGDHDDRTILLVE